MAASSTSIAEGRLVEAMVRVVEEWVLVLKDEKEMKVDWKEREAELLIIARAREPVRISSPRLLVLAFHVHPRAPYLGFTQLALF